MSRLSNLQLFGLAVLIWGTTWHAIVHQIAHVTPEYGVTLRFALAGALVLAVARWRGEALRFAPRVHAHLVLQGVFMYSLAYLGVYHAEKHVPSGLVAVGYSASPLLAGLAARALWGTGLPRGFVAGGAIGMLGVALIFWPELSAAGGRESAGLGLALTVAAVLLSTVGSLAASRNPRFGLPFWPAMGWAMLYSAVLSGSVAWATGSPLHLPSAPAWWISLAWLSIAGTVIAFGAFLTLQQRLGPGKASTIGVMTPVVALAVSALFEGYEPEAFTFGGAALAVLGNVLMLKREAPSVRPDADPAAG